MKTEPTWYANIWIAGSLETAKATCLEFCSKVGLCVTVTPTSYVYSYGAQEGVLVRLISYPKFPESQEARESTAEALAAMLKSRLFQRSYSIEYPDRTVYYGDEE